jgi:hypothetical protein
VRFARCANATHAMEPHEWGTRQCALGMGRVQIPHLNDDEAVVKMGHPVL